MLGEWYLPPGECQVISTITEGTISISQPESSSAPTRIFQTPLRQTASVNAPQPDHVPRSGPQGVGIKPTGHTFAPTRRVGLSTFPLATDPVSTAISESLSHFGLAADFCSSSVSSFLKSSRSRSGSRAPSVR